jgi:DHA3 family macrolide efflux protein-like MFS transporter
MDNPSQETRPLSGMKGFTLIWVGQIVSVLASNMTAFALTLWVYGQTESATALGMMQVAFITPFLLISPLAGVWVDRYNRKLMMMVSDLGAAVGTTMILVLQATGNLQYWHLYIAMVILGLGNTFQWPAYSAAISTMVSKEQYSRANGMMSLIEAGPAVFSPILAGALLPTIGLTGILIIDLATFGLAILSLLIVFIPQPQKTVEGEKGEGSVWQESWFGFKYIFARRSLLGLQLIFLFGNLFTGIAFTLMAPMILARTNMNELLFGSVQSAMAIGGIAGGVLMTVWAGFKRRVHGVLSGWIFACLGMMLLGVGQGLSLWLPAAVLASIFEAMINTSNQAIWQAKVAPDVQGRVFSARRLIAWITNPISPIIAGTLADFVMEPAMTNQTRLSSLFGGLVGTGPGSGMGLLMVFSSLAAGLVALSGYFIPAIRNAEVLLPDHDQLDKAGSGEERV